MSSRAKEFLKKKVYEEILLYYQDISHYPQEKLERIIVRWSDDSVKTESHRYDLLTKLIPDVKEKKILDMAAGCGSFVIQGLLDGWNVFGVEPEDWKHELIDIKFMENNYPEVWRDRLVRGVGEKLPFADESFDAFDSWQTIEHVQNEEECIKEFYRVLKKGGSGILRGPSYFSFFEGHYHMFWFPMMGDSWFARLYLKIMNRPSEGLATFHPVNPFKIRIYARNAGFKIVNIKKKIIYEALKRRIRALRHPIFAPILPLAYIAWDLYMIRFVGRQEATISLLLIKE